VSLNADQGSSLHILTITPFYPTKNDDANGCFVSEPLAALQKRGVQHSVFALNPFYRKSVPLHPDSVPAEIVRYPAVPGGWGLASSGAFLFAALVRRIRALHARSPIDLIHAHGPLPAGHAAMLLKRELGIPFVVSVHGLDAYSDHQVPGRPGQWCRRVSRLVYQTADQVICISEHVREQVLNGGNSRTTVVYNGADPALFTSAASAAETSEASSSKNDSAAASPRILSVGNLIPIKGHELLLRSIAAFSGNHPTLALDLVGDGPLREKLTALAGELGIAGRVRFLGRRGRREVAALMRQSTLFVLPSTYEGLGCVYLEAMAAGKVAVGCRGQGIEEIIRHGSNGWLVAPDDLTDLAAGLGKLLDHETLRAYIANEGRETVLNNYTIDHQANRLLRVYQSSISGSAQ
jgi:glycosyltransferase involved in cell wall biosynthesis